MPPEDTDAAMLFWMFAWFAAGGVAVIGWIFLDGSEIMKRELAVAGFPLHNRRVSEAVTALRAAATAEDVARLESWKSTTIAKLRTLTTEEGWAAVAKDARLAEGSPPTSTTHAASTAPAESATVDVVLESVGEHKARVIMAIRRFKPALELMEAKHLVERAPVEIFTSLTHERANQLRAELSSVGARVSIRPTRGA